MGVRIAGADASRSRKRRRVLSLKKATGSQCVTQVCFTLVRGTLGFWQASRYRDGGAANRRQEDPLSWLCLNYEPRFGPS